MVTEYHQKAVTSRKVASTTRSIMGNCIIYGVMLVVVLISFFPMLWAFMSSFKTNAEILQSAFKLPSHFSLDGYRLALKIAPISTYYKNSIIVAFFSTALNVFFVGMASYVIARYEFKLKNLIILLFSSTLLIPAISISYPIFLTIKTIGLINTKTALVLIYIGTGLPVTFFVLRSYFLTIPKAIEEAAVIDGASFFKTFTGIVLPMAKPGLFTAAILQFLGVWNEFFFALLITSGNGSRTLPLSLSYFTSMFFSNYTALFAAVIMVTAPTIIVYSIMSEQVISSLTAGAVKG